MIICIIIFSILAIGIASFILRNIFTHLYYKWKDIEEYYAPTLKERVWKDFQFIYLPNENYNEKLYKQAVKKTEFYNKISSDFFFGLGMVGCIIGGFGTLICSIVPLATNFGTESELKYLNKLEERTAIIKELENNSNNEHVYKDIINFNADLRNIKMKYDNPWFNWFVNAKIAKNIDYIEVEYVYDNT